MRIRIGHVVAVFLLLSVCFGMMKLDGDEFSFVREPYEMLGGDYTAGYLKQGETAKALRTAVRAYVFYWKYRSLTWPIIPEKDRGYFQAEEKRFGYRDPAEASADSAMTYRERLIVPEPRRFYSHGAGKPLLNAVLEIPGLGLVQLATHGGHDLLWYQNHRNYHPVFLLVRLASLLAGLASLLLVYRFARPRLGESKAALAAAAFALLPASVIYFPNIHHDAVLCPFALLAGVAFVKRRYAWSGAALGLALAAKNAAVFLAVPMVVLAAADLVRWLRARTSPEARGRFLDRFRGLFIAGALSLVVLTPFASPKAYVEELLTPVTGRGYDPHITRTVGVFGQIRGLEGDTGYSEERKVAYALRAMLPYFNLGLLVILGIALTWGKLEDDLDRFSFWFLIALFPYALIFSQQFTYRSLMFLPFFGFLAGRVLTRRQMLVLLGILVLVDGYFAWDPITCGAPRVLSTHRSLIQAIGSGFSAPDGGEVAR